MQRLSRAMEAQVAVGKKQLPLNVLWATVPPVKAFLEVKSVFEPPITTQHEQPTTTFPSIASTTSDPATKLRSGSHANKSCDGSCGGRISRDEDPLDPSPPVPRSQLRPKPPINHYQHHRHSHHSQHNHSSAAGIAALAANAVFAGSLTLPANAAFTRRQRLRWTLPPPPPADPPTIDSTPPPTAAADIAMITLSRQCRRRVTTLGERKCYGRGRAEELPEGAAAGVRVRALGHYSRGSGSVTEGEERNRYRRGRRQT